MAFNFKDKTQNEKFDFLPEQKEVIHAPEDKIKVVAGAGTGKTTTLEGFSVHHSDESMLYLAFNKAIQLEASERFPSNVVCKTMHSVAYAKEALKYKHKLEFNLKSIAVARALDISVGDAFLGISVLNTFLHSAEYAIGIDHAFESGVLPAKQEKAVETAKEIWRRMIDVKNDTLPMTHDGYLKLFHLNGQSLGRFNRVLMDEAQDANPVTAAIVNAFEGGKILVGDQNQSIYAFRGAKNAMADFKAKEYLLRTSFRFGPEIAAMANLVIEHSINDSMRIIGGGKSSSVISMVGNNHIHEKHETVAMIARTNSFLLGRALENIEKGVTFSVIGGVESLRFADLMDVYSLYAGEKENIRSPYISQYDDWDHFSESADESGDPETSWQIKIIEKYTTRLPSVINKVRANNIEDYRQADEALTTGHRSKGLEFDHVMMGEDFASLSTSDGGDEDDDDSNGVHVQECNLIYVALTRAKKSLALNSDLITFRDNPVKNKATHAQVKKNKLKV
jgi:superfamily I DNA/RNA helicase